MRKLSAITWCLAAAAGCVGARSAVTVRSLEQMQFSDALAWRWTDVGLELHGASSYTPPHRSPLSLAILREIEFEDFDLDVKALSTKAEYGHRDLIVVFVYRGPSHYAYAHLASAADANAHHIMLVDGAPRRPVSAERSSGVAWGEAWHDIRVRRRGESVEVFFDAERVLVGNVPAGRGRVGVGSFDDTGIFRDLTITPR